MRLWKTTLWKNWIDSFLLTHHNPKTLCNCKINSYFCTTFFYSVKLKSENQYIIQFKGLKEGVHVFAMHMDKAFFESFEQLEVPDGEVTVNIELIKKINFLELAIEMSGEIQVQCDRCLGYFNLPVVYDDHLVVKFSESEKEPDDTIIFLHPEDNEINLKHYLYECMSLSIPIRKVHPDLPDGEPGCDPEMLDRLKEMLIEE